VRTYVNGALVHTEPASGAVGDASAIDELRIGSRGVGGSHFDGRIDDVRVWSRALGHEEIREGLEAVAANATGLVAWWKLDESSGNTLLDASPNGFSLALDGLGANAAPTRRPDDRDRPGGALYFDGADDYVSVGEPVALAELVMTSGLTLEAWVFPRGPGSHPTAGGAIVHKEGEYGLVRMSNGYLAFSLATATPGWLTTVTSAFLPEREWSHVALVYSASLGQARVYLNGVLAESVTVTGSIGDVHTGWNELRIGGRQHPTNVQQFHGVIDEVRVWRTARSGSAIASNRSSSIQGNAAGLAAYWRFDQTAGGVAFDSSVEAHHAALGGRSVAASPCATFGPQLPGYASSLLAPPPPPVSYGCGIGPELVGLLPLLGCVQRARRRRRSAR
jgi:hypothetical protein